MVLDQNFFHKIFLGPEGSDTSTEETKDMVYGIKRFGLPDFRWFYPKNFKLEKQNKVFFFCEEFMIVADSYNDQYRLNKVSYSELSGLKLLSNKQDQTHRAILFYYEDKPETLDPNTDSNQFFTRDYVESIPEIYKFLEERV